MKIKNSSLKKQLKVKLIKFFNITNNDFFLIAGPCVIEDEDITFKIAIKLKEITEKLSIPFIFKSSYDKANRTSIKSYRGPGLKKGIKILSIIRQKLKIPILTDVHSPDEARFAAKYVDVLQIPAFLCRQTDILLAAGKTGKPVNIKKGQFLSPYEIKNIIEKIKSTGNNNILLTERGYIFGYNNLVVDLKSIYYMKQTGYPVIIDVTHSVQRPGGAGIQSGGDREYIETIAKGCVAAGAYGVFMEVHPKPEKALSDSAVQYPLNKVEKLLRELKRIYEVVKYTSVC
ncbi:MAG: 3-deoxy-8-phosphooctulonate synthase [Candidatus Goldbacteria bacterium]|nr:3-deoxy-8-phosphooctulonate synthase [Candidatus Goldiibacteriota bacterium]